jgi:hypothetical protein
MANPFPSGDPGDDPLALFGPETDTTAGPAASKTGSAPAKPARGLKPAATESRPVAREADVGGAPADEAGNIIYPSPSVLKKLAAEVPQPTLKPRELAVEVVGPPPAAGSISFDRICSVKGLGFVEGVALIQTTCDAVLAAGQSAGVPELHGLFLTADGEVVLHGPPTGEPPARELALLLHQLVTPNLMPPAGRLFVGRWINNDRPELTEFASELAYFARPNSRELLGTLHARCDGIRASAQIHRLEPKRPVAVPQPPAVGEKTEPERQPPLKAWMRSTKPLILVAVVVLIATTATAIATFLSNPEPAQAKPPVEEVATPVEDAAAVLETPLPAGTKPSTPSLAPPASPPRIPRGNGGSGDAGPPGRRAAVIPTPPLGRRRTAGNQPTTASIESQDAARSLPVEGPIPVLPSRQTLDLRIYSASDAEVEPPRLRSAEIPELLIAGFEKRINRVELVISERGDVQQVHMIGPPQRMPDVMLLSRAKQLLFDPAIRDGVPVRYRLILSWNVTP